MCLGGSTLFLNFLPAMVSPSGCWQHTFFSLLIAGFEYIRQDHYWQSQVSQVHENGSQITNMDGKVIGYTCN
jgi:hypothetical protein